MLFGLALLVIWGSIFLLSAVFCYSKRPANAIRIYSIRNPGCWLFRFRTMYMTQSEKNRGKSVPKIYIKTFLCENIEALTSKSQFEQINISNVIFVFIYIFGILNTNQCFLHKQFSFCLFRNLLDLGKIIRIFYLY